MPARPKNTGTWDVNSIIELFHNLVQVRSLIFGLSLFEYKAKKS